ncbi:MAG: alanyl-tRNA editing protein [Bacillota bacterium]
MELRTELIYLSDRSQLEFSARVLEIRERVKDVVTILDRTAFFPAGGGQPGDGGELDSVPVYDTTIEDGEVLHHSERRPPFGEGDTILGRVDGPRRMDHSRQHTAQHLISAVLARKLGANTLSFHLGARECTVDFDISPDAIDREILDGLESQINAFVMQNLPVLVDYAGEADETSMEYRKAPAEDLRGPLRLVTIGDDLDVSACCGTHTRNTGEIGPIFLEDTSRVRGGLRLTFLAGDRALGRNLERRNLLVRLASRLETPVRDLAARVENILSERDELIAKMKAAASSLAALRARELVRRSRNAFLLEETWDESEVPDENYPRAVAAQLPEDHDWVFVAGLISEDAVRVTMTRSPRSEVDLTGKPLKLFRKLGGRGGGSPDLVRGAIGPEDYRAFARALRTHLDSDGARDGV